MRLQLVESLQGSDTLNLDFIDVDNRSFTMLESLIVEAEKLIYILQYKVLGINPAVGVDEVEADETCVENQVGTLGTLGSRECVDAVIVGAAAFAVDRWPFEALRHADSPLVADVFAAKVVFKGNARVFEVVACAKSDAVARHAGTGSLQSGIVLLNRSHNIGDRALCRN